MPFVLGREVSDEETAWKRLTLRETQVFDLVRQGKTNKEIGSALFISERTAKLHVANILHKRRCKNRVELYRSVEGEHDVYGFSGC